MGYNSIADIMNECMNLYLPWTTTQEQESPAVADKPARRESMLKLLQFDDRRAYNIVADNM